MTSEKKTLAEELAHESELLRRRFVHHTRPKRPLSLQEAMELARKMAGEPPADGECGNWKNCACDLECAIEKTDGEIGDGKTER